MLTADEEKYLLTIPLDKIAKINAYEPEVKGVAQKIIAEIQGVVPQRKILYVGASALGIAGQNDIDFTS